MRRIQLVILFVIVTLNSTSQDANKVNIKKIELTFGTFNSLNEKHKVTVNPVIAGHSGDYYFENRYGYEVANSASINVGRRILKKINHAEIIPMTGLIFGSFKGLTAELQTSLDYTKWTFSTDNQFSLEYTTPAKSLFYNWSVVRYKVTSFIRAGLTTFFDKRINKNGVFDRGATVAFLYKNWALRFYAFNYETAKRYYWLGLRYTFTTEFIGK